MTLSRSRTVVSEQPLRPRSPGTLIVLTGASLVLNYAFAAIAAIVGGDRRNESQSVQDAVVAGTADPRDRGPRLHHDQTDGQAIRVTSITMLIGLVYWALVIWPQKGKAWNLKDPVLDQAAHIEVPVKTP